MPPTGRAASASSNSGTKAPGAVQPRSPPCGALASSEFARASCSKVRAPDRMSRLKPDQAPCRRLGRELGRRPQQDVTRPRLIDRERIAVLAGRSASGRETRRRCERFGRDLTGLKRLRPPRRTDRAGDRPRACRCRRRGLRFPSSEISRATVAKSSPPPRPRRNAASARPRRSLTTSGLAPSGTTTRIWAMSSCTVAPAALRRLLDQGVDLGVADLDQAPTSRSRTRSTIIWSRMLSRNLL